MVNQMLHYIDLVLKLNIVYFKEKFKIIIVDF